MNINFLKLKNSTFFKTAALALCILLLCVTVYAPVSEAWFVKKFKCLKALAILAIATSNVVIACGATVASLIFTGASISSLVLGAACLGSIAYWKYRGRIAERYCD